MMARFILAAVLAVCTAASADTLTGRVVGISDGDTITLLVDGNSERVRLAGIDAPEIGQPYGDAAKRALAGRVFDRMVVVEYDKRDRYGRVVGKVLSRGEDVGLRQIEAGLAWWFRRYQNEQALDDRLAYLRAEEAASSARRGLWADPAPVPPWDWRKRRSR